MVKTKGIVLQQFKYGEYDLIVKIYTESFGLVSFIVYGVRKPKAKIKPILFSPLSLVEIDMQTPNKNGLQRFKEIRISIPFNQIPFSISHSAIALFLTEIIYKSIKEEHIHQPDLFAFLLQSIIFLDSATHHIGNFHIEFMLKFTYYLGFSPLDNYGDTQKYFNLQKGCFESSGLSTAHMSYADSEQFAQVIQQVKGFASIDALFKNKKERHDFLIYLIRYYAFHTEQFLPIKTIDVLEEVFM